MKTFQITKHKNGQSQKSDSGYVMANNFAEAKKEFSRVIERELHERFYGDNILWYGDDTIDEMKADGQDVSFYDGAGFYEDRSIVLSKAEINAGFDRFSHDMTHFELSPKGNKI